MIIYPDIDPVALSLGPLKIHWYGLMYLAGFVGAWFYGVQRTKREDINWTRQMVEDVIFYGAMGVILGGRIGYTLFYNFPEFIKNPISIFYIQQGGMSFHGGMLGVFIGLYLYGRKKDMSFFQVSDFIAPWVPIGLGAGRIGNFINHELWGRPMETVVPWALDYGDHIARHPSSLYQALTEGLLLFLILWWYSSKPRPYMAVSAVFMLCYGSFRFLTEFYRTPDAQLGYIAFDWLTMGQLLSLPMVLFGIVLYWLAMKNTKASSDVNEIVS
ncbi:MAG: prolipoprotein diacylglyceryl transferase [Gammaproteobacteria bacterium]|nr:prolipoprotein diacylglyceryl transferase [Gammaproteobacteria bacterium]